MMVGGRLNFSTSDSGQMFCPLQVVENEPIQYADLKIQYDTGKKETITNKLKVVIYVLLKIFLLWSYQTILIFQFKIIYLKKKNLKVSDK